jgi:DNA-binding Xre family transcriptional regulator
MVSKRRKKKTALPYKRATRKNNELVPNFIKEWRELRGYTSQMKLARDAHLPSQTISRLEAHTLAWTLYSLKKIAAVLDCSVGDLIEHDPTKGGPRYFELHNMATPAELRQMVAACEAVIAKRRSVA